ncbi:MAG: hypothetical protein OHK0050_29380 [Roseiflexaceae bacterium]
MRYTPAQRNQRIYDLVEASVIDAITPNVLGICAKFDAQSELHIHAYFRGKITKDEADLFASAIKQVEYGIPRVRAIHFHRHTTWFLPLILHGKWIYRRPGNPHF